VTDFEQQGANAVLAQLSCPADPDQFRFPIGAQGSTAIDTGGEC
jgi:hypothetical protein